MNVAAVWTQAPFDAPPPSATSYHQQHQCKGTCTGDRVKDKTCPYWPQRQDAWFANIGRGEHDSSEHLRGLTFNTNDHRIKRVQRKAKPEPQHCSTVPISKRTDALVNEAPPSFDQLEIRSPVGWVGVLFPQCRQFSAVSGELSRSEPDRQRERKRDRKVCTESGYEQAGHFGTHASQAHRSSIS